MKESTKLISLFAVAVFGLLLISSCGSSQNLSESAPNTPSPTITSTVTSTLTPTPQETPADGIHRNPHALLGRLVDRVL